MPNNSQLPEAHSGMGLCLAGGGITGAMYQVGCLAALEDTFEDFQACDFEVFVGASSGATVASALAGGFSATRLYRAMLDPADDFFPLQRQHLIRLDMREWRRVFMSAVSATRHLFSSATSRPLELNVWEELDRFYDSLPAGFFQMDAYEEFLSNFYRRRGIPEDFSAMPRTLAIVANDLDAGERVVFGAGGRKDVPLAKAVAASSAVPLVFAPVRIGERDFVDGGLGEVGHVDVAEQLGSDLTIVVNPMVPISADPSERKIPTGHGRMKRVRDKGLIWVHNQSWRIRTEARFQALLDRYRAAHQNQQVVLIEPERNNTTMFMNSPMNFSARRAILEDGYRTTTVLLRDRTSELSTALQAKGLRLKPDPA